MPTRQSIQPILDRAIEIIRSKVNTERIYLFGSYAYGEPTDESDIDLMVISRDSIKNALDLILEIDEALKEVSTIDFDIVPDSKEHFMKCCKSITTLQKEVYHKGEVIYDESGNEGYMTNAEDVKYWFGKVTNSMRLMYGGEGAPDGYWRTIPEMANKFIWYPLLVTLLVAHDIEPGRSRVLTELLDKVVFREPQMEIFRAATQRMNKYEDYLDEDGNFHVYTEELVNEIISDTHQLYDAVKNGCSEVLNEAI